VESTLTTKFVYQLAQKETLVVYSQKNICWEIDYLR